MVLANNKTGMFFTLMAIVVATFLVTMYIFSMSAYKTTNIKNRILTMDSFLKSTEKDLERQIYIFGFRSILSILNYIAENGVYVQDINATLNEAFFNGTIMGREEELIMGTTFEEINEQIIQRGRRMGIEIIISRPIIYIEQIDPWKLRLIFKFDLFASDENGIARWNKTQTINSFISVTNFEDPFYIVKTNGRVLNKIKKTNYTFFVSGSDVQNLLNHAINSYYIESSTAPSFLDRLSGINSQNPNGIESLVNLEKLTLQGITVLDKSVVDYIYFSDQNPTSFRIQGMPNWFKLDSEHLAIYNATHLAI